MIDYLEQLERDLVEAIDRREAGAPAPRRPRRLRPLLRPIVAVLAVALVLATVAVVARRTAEHDVAVRPEPTVTPRPTPQPTGRGFKLVGDLTRTRAGTWQGRADGPGGPATLTIIGPVDLSRDRCCGSPQRPGSFTKHVVHFTWATQLGELEGCIDNAIYRRPHARWVWDGTGRVLTATGRLSRYRGLGAAIAGRTPTTSPHTAHISIEAGTDPPPARC